MRLWTETDEELVLFTDTLNTTSFHNLVLVSDSASSGHKSSFIVSAQLTFLLDFEPLSCFEERIFTFELTIVLEGKAPFVLET